MLWMPRVTHGGSMRCFMKFTPGALPTVTMTASAICDANVLSYLRVYKGHGVAVALNMSNAPQKVTIELKAAGFTSAKTLLATGESSAKRNEVSLEPYGVFIGELRK
jgi:hypothetical protein